MQEDGTPENWDIVAANSPVGSKNILDKLSPYLSIQKNCGSVSGSGCFSGMYRQMVGTDWGIIDTTFTSSLGLNKAILADGTLIYIQVRDPNCKEGDGVNTSLATQNICAFIGVDINGFKKPNQWGYDLFTIMITKYGLVPRGSPDYLSIPFSTSCRATSNGWACAAWVLQNENMDYLHCSDLAWGGKTKCD